jgi:hypothetical protein
VAAPSLRCATGEELGEQILKLGKNVAHAGAREIEASPLNACMAELIVASALVLVG